MFESHNNLKINENRIVSEDGDGRSVRVLKTDVSLIQKKNEVRPNKFYGTFSFLLIFCQFFASNLTTYMKCSSVYGASCVHRFRSIQTSKTRPLLVTELLIWSELGRHYFDYIHYHVSWVQSNLCSEFGIFVYSACNV
jgi:hypothetical protein